LFPKISHYMTKNGGNSFWEHPISVVVMSNPRLDNGRAKIANLLSSKVHACRDHKGNEDQDPRDQPCQDMSHL